jgi:outer membrane protein insertion porin family
VSHRRTRSTPASRAGVLLLAAALGAAAAPAARAQTPVAPAPPATAPAVAPPVLRIEVQGNRNVSSDQIRNWFALRPGDRFDPARVSRAVRELSSKGRFSDVRVEGEEEAGGVVLYVLVVEYPQVSEVRVEGEDHVDEKDLRGTMRLAAGSFVSPAALRTDVEKLAALYKDKGYYRVAIHDSLAAREGGKPDLVLRIDEGQKASVQSIVFVGNERVPAKDLRKQMETKQDGLLRGGDLKQDVLQQDFERLASYYRDRGYLDAQVLGHSLDVAPNGKDLTIQIRLQEGPQYRTGQVTWSGNTKFPDEEIRKRVKLRTGEPFSESAYEASTGAVYELYNDAGYIYFKAVPRRDVHDQIVDLAYTFEEGDPASINRIRIVGNTKTRDKVILREFLALPGDVFDRSRLMRSIREVYALGFFDDVQIERFTPREDSSVDLEVRVVEKQTGQLGAGAGYSAVNAITGFFEVAETNLFGTGQRLSLRWEFSKRQNEVEFSYVQPWLFDTPTTLGLELFNSSRRSRINDFYRDKRTGAALTIGRRLDFLDYTRVSWRYRAESIELTDFDPDYTGPLRERFADGPRRTFGTGLTLRRNSTDSPFFPTSGTDTEMSSDLVGTFLGGDESYLRTSASMSWFRSVAGSKLTLMLRSRFGMLHGLQDRDTPDYERFRLGGNRYFGVRGYDDYEIVPVGNPLYLGGQAMSIFTTELVYPFTPKVHGVAFFDAGNTWNSFREADLSLMRKGAGLGVRVEVPMLGQLGLDYGYGFDRIDSLGRDRDRWNLHFTFGSLF